MKAAADVRGWSVLGADTVRLGTVCEVREDGHLVVELDPETLKSHMPSGDEEQVLNREFAPEGGPTVAGQDWLQDPNPLGAEEQVTRFQRPGALQHVGEYAGGQPWNRGDMADPEEPSPLRVLIPAGRVHLKEAEREVVLDKVRSVDVADLPRVG